MSNNFSSQINQFKSNLKGEPKSFADFPKTIEQNTNIENPFKSNLFSTKSDNPFQKYNQTETNAQNNLFNPHNNNIENKQLRPLENKQVVIIEKEIPGNKKIIEKTSYITNGGEQLTDEEMKEIKKIAGNSSTSTTTKTITTTTITKDGQKISTKTTEKITKIGGNGNTITTEYNKEEKTLPILSDKIVFKETKDNRNESKDTNSNDKNFENNQVDNETNNIDKNFDNLFKNYYNENDNLNEEKENNIDIPNENDIQNNIKIEEINKNKNNIIFGAPNNDNKEYIPLSSNVSFGLKTNLNRNNTNKSSSIEKSSEQEYIVIDENVESENRNIPLSNNKNVKFGINEDKGSKNELYSSPKKNSLNLVDDVVKFGYEENKIVDEEKNEIEQNDEMDLEQGEIKENNEKPESENDNLNKIKEDKKEEKKKEIIFNKKLFDYNEPEKGKETFFTQKLFQNNNEKNINQGKSLFGDLFNKTNNNFNTFFDNKKTEEMFFKGNNVKNNQTETEKEENEIKPTLNDMIKEGGIFNNDSQKKENNNINIFTNSLNNINPFNSNNKDKINDKNIENENKENNNQIKNDLSSPLTAYINQNKGKNFITENNKGEDKKNLFISINTGSLFNSPFINSSYNPFSSILSSNQNNTNEKQNMNNEEKKEENKSPFLTNTDTKENKIKEENKNSINSINNKNSISNPNISNNSNQQSFNIYDSTGNLEKYDNLLNKNIEKNLAKNNNDIVGQKMNNDIEIKTTSFLFPNLKLEKSKSEIPKKSSESSLFPGLGFKKEELAGPKEIKPLFPGKEFDNNNNNNPLCIFSNENNIGLKQSKSSLFGEDSKSGTNGLFNIKNENIEDKNKSQENKEDTKEEKKLTESNNSFTLFDSKKLNYGAMDDKDKGNYMTEEEKIQLENKIKSLNNEQIKEIIKNINEGEKNSLMDINTSHLEIKGLPDKKIREIEQYANEFIELNDKINQKKENTKQNLPTINNIISYNKENENKENIVNVEKKDMEMKDENDEENEEENDEENEEENEELDIEIDINNNQEITQENKDGNNIENKENIPETKSNPFNNENYNTNNSSGFNVEVFQNLQLNNSKSENVQKPVKKSLFGDFFNKNEQDFGTFFSKNSGNLFNEDKKGLFDNNKNSLFENKQGGGIFDNNKGGLFGMKEGQKLFEDKNYEKVNENEGLFSNNNRNKEKDKNNNKTISEKEKNAKVENMNLFSNNDGKSLFSGLSDNNNKNLKFFDSESTPIKTNTFFKNENEAKEKMEMEKKEQERVEKEKKEEEEKLNQEQLEKEKKLEEEKNGKEKEERIKREKEEEKLERKILMQKETEEVEEIEDNEEKEKEEEKLEFGIIGNEKNRTEDNREIKIELFNEGNKNDNNENEISEPEELLEEEEELSEEEEEYNEELSTDNKPSKEETSNIKIIQKIYSERKPLRKEIYFNLLKKMINITNSRKNKINEQEKNIITIHCNNLNEYLKELEEKINLMKKGYIETLVKKHFEKDKNKKMEIILKANISKKRNDVKKIFKKLMRYIDNNLEPANQKFYYILILKILNQYEIINEDEINKTMKIFKQKNKIIKNKESAINTDINPEFDNNVWISQNYSKKGNAFKVFAFLLPFAYFINYIYANIKS